MKECKKLIDVYQKEYENELDIMTGIDVDWKNSNEKKRKRLYKG